MSSFLIQACEKDLRPQSQLVTMTLYPPKWVKYPKLLTLAMTFAIAYFIAGDAHFASARELILGSGYIGTFIAGIMFAYGFTAAPATAILLILGKTQNIYIAAALAGLGALLADLAIFRIVRHSFTDELEILSKEWAVVEIASHAPKRIMQYVMPVLGCLIIASPLPDEIGVTMLAASRNISGKVFTAASFLLNTAGAFVILWIGSGT